MNLLSTVTPAKNVQYFTGLLYFSKFDKCDVKSHSHKVTGRNLTGLFFNRPITVALFRRMNLGHTVILRCDFVEAL